MGTQARRGPVCLQHRLRVCERALSEFRERLRGDSAFSEKDDCPATGISVIDPAAIGCLRQALQHTYQWHWRYGCHHGGCLVGNGRPYRRKGGIGA